MVAVAGEGGEPPYHLGHHGVDAADPAAVADVRGPRIDGAAQDDRAGRAVAGGADINGDGHGDVLVGAPYANNNDRVDSGSGYILPDVVAPDTKIDSGPPPPPSTTNDSTPTFTFEATEPASFQCSIVLKGATPSYAACSSPYTPRALKNGTYTFSVFATDASGNFDPTPAAQDFTVYAGSNFLATIGRACTFCSVRSSCPVRPEGKVI